MEPDVVFGLGDLTAESAHEDWLGYRRWLEGVQASVFDLLGNHDRDYTVFTRHHYAKEYFTVPGRVSGTKAVGIVNTIFVLVSEEHNPKGSANRLTSTVPAKRFRFLEEVLQAYGQDHNVFIVSHTLLRGTTALSNDWGFNDTRSWTTSTKQFFRVFDRYPVVADLTGHTHIDYRYRSRVRNIDGSKRGEKIGKFVDGRLYDALPDVYFLNMPCVDTAHGWFGSNSAVLRELGKTTARARRSPVRKMFMKVEEKGLPFFDILYRSPINNILGRAAIYYTDLVPGQHQATVTTRWLRPNRDVQRYPIDLRRPVEVGRGEERYLTSDLSLRTKRNLVIQRDAWFLVPIGERGRGAFSQRFPDPVAIVGLKSDAAGLADHAARWKGSRDGGRTWDGSWRDDPQALGDVDVVLLEIHFQAEANASAPVRDIRVKTAS